MVKCLPIMHEVLGSIPTTERVDVGDIPSVIEHLLSIYVYDPEFKPSI